MENLLLLILAITGISAAFLTGFFVHFLIICACKGREDGLQFFKDEF